MRIDPKPMIEALRQVVKRLHYPVEVMLVWVLSQQARGVRVGRCELTRKR